MWMRELVSCDDLVVLAREMRTWFAIECEAPESVGERRQVVGPPGQRGPVVHRSPLSRRSSLATAPGRLSPLGR